MKSSMFSKGMIFILLTVYVCSCGEFGNLPENQASLECLNFTQTELSSVGTLHNQYVAEVYSKVNFTNCTNCKEDVIQGFRELDVDLFGLGISKDSFINLSLHYYDELESIEFDLRNWEDHPFNAIVFSYLSQIMSEVDVVSNYYDFVFEMENIQNEADLDNEMTCFDLEFLTGVLEVAKNSAYLWFPRSAGGAGYYSISHAGNGEPRWSWRRALRADISASAGFFLTNSVLWATAVTVPGVNAAILGGWVLSSGIASALGGIE